MDFHTKINKAEFWFSQAFQMFEASQALFKSVESIESSNVLSVGAHKGSSFLLGIAIENAIKGVLAYENKLKVKGDKFLPQQSFVGCKPHDIYQYADLLQIKFNEEELELFKRLSVYTIWAGKYGTPLDKNFFDKEQKYLFQKDSDFLVAKNALQTLRANAGFSEETGWPKIVN